MLCFLPGKKWNKDSCTLKTCGFLNDVSMRRNCQSVPAKALGFMETNGKIFSFKFYCNPTQNRAVIQKCVYVHMMK